jgi:CheY-like chemotaxis protein/HPt (histidine-containing phosphotransfer) domain-containing protein
MNGVIGMIDLLNQTALDDEQQRLARIAKVSSMSLLNIINDILDFSKIEAGRMKLESIPVTWRGLIDSVAEMVSGSLLEKQLRLLCLVDPAVPRRVRGDQTRLRQLLMNLLSNAIKFTSSTDDRQGEILVRLYLAADNEQQLVLEVEDNGIGISPEQLENLFHPFVQADTSTHRRYGGSGLGLSICSRLVSLMQGDIRCVSQEGEGSRFIVTLPCVPVNHDAPVLSLDGCRLLLLSNDMRFREFLEADLTARGAEVLFAEEARKKGVDVLLFAGLWQPEEKRRLVHAYLQRYPDTPSVVLIAESEREEPTAFGESVLVAVNPFRPEAIHHGLMVATGGETQEADSSEQVFREPRPVPSVKQAEAEGRLVLVAEDNAVNQEVIKRQLNLLGYAAEVAENGEVALQMMQQRRYGLLLSDCHMPQMDGFELTSRLRDQELNEEDHLPVIAITANAMQGEAQRCLLAGMDGYLAKPVELTRLKETLARWLPLVDEPVTEEATKVQRQSANLPDAIDRQLLSRYLGDDEKVQNDFLHKFTEQYQPVIQPVRTQIEQGKWQQVAAMMHKLKSSSKAIGAAELSERCIELEQAAKAHDADRAESLGSGVADAFARVSAYVEQLPR